MQKAFEKIIEKVKAYYDAVNPYVGNAVTKIVNQVAEEMGVSKTESGNEEVCEWEEVRLPGEIFWINCRYREDREYSPYFEFCPYCGKKIKVIN